jgi:GrpB-like predicted nucleotidyltransferase (UPF0157 family)
MASVRSTKIIDDSTTWSLAVVDSKVDHFLLWRNRLMTHAQLLSAYDELKRGFEGQSMNAYREAKRRFIAERPYE